MGQQQLLLIMLSVIVIGVAIAVGINLFTANAIEQKRNEIINECTLLASEAQLYYRRPVALGGGGKSFVGWQIPTSFKITEAGSFEVASVTAEKVIITGTGNEVVTNDDSVKIKMIINKDNFETIIIN